MNVTMGQLVILMCSANGTDVMLHWEIGGQNYSDCSDVNCVTFSKMSGSIMSSIMFRVDNFDDETNTRVKCVVSQMCGDKRVLYSEANVHIACEWKALASIVTVLN